MSQIDWRQIVCSQLWTYVGNLFHVVDHLIIALSLLAEPGEEGFAEI